jgi:hypothetical protein
MKILAGSVTVPPLLLARLTALFRALPGAWWGAVAADDLAVGALDLAGAVGADGQGPAEFVQDDMVVPPALCRPQDYADPKGETAGRSQEGDSDVGIIRILGAGSTDEARVPVHKSQISSQQVNERVSQPSALIGHSSQMRLAAVEIPRLCRSNTPTGLRDL